MQSGQWDVMVVGAGLSGLVCASALSKAGLRVCVVEKARGTGGRMSSKRLTIKDKNISFDLGAPYIQASHSEFEAWLDDLENDGVLRSMTVNRNRQAECAWVAPSRNSQLTRYLSKDLDVFFGEKASDLSYKNGLWTLETQSQLNAPQPQSAQLSKAFAQAPHVVFSAPAEQTLQLLPENHGAVSWLTNIESEPVFVSTFVVKDLSEDISEKVNSIQHLDGIDSVVLEHSKPERDHLGYQVIKVQSSPQWALAFLDFDSDQIAIMLRRRLENGLDYPLDVVASHTHRWLYSQYPNPIQNTKGFLSFHDGLHVCGDFFDLSDYGTERAYLSGHKLSSHLLDSGLNDQGLLRGILEQSEPLTSRQAL